MRTYRVFSGLIFLIGFSFQISNAHAWSTEVHNAMIMKAFPNETMECWLKMQEGSKKVDSMINQLPGNSYMHAMRAPFQSETDAIKKMWEYIDQKYAEIKTAKRNGRENDACFARGMALHPVMDSTSPAHRGPQTWNILAVWEIFHHGDIWRDVESPLIVNFRPIWVEESEWPNPSGAPISQEDIGYLNSHPEFLNTTIGLMRVVERVEMLGF